MKLLALLSFLVLLAPTDAADWSQWRGPARNGLLERSPSLVNAFGGESSLWQSEPIASGESGGRGSLVVHSQRVYGLTRARSKAEALTEVFCLSAETGTTIWRSPLHEGRAAETGSSTPCIADGRLFVVGSGNKVHCLNVEDGNPVWEAELSRQETKPIASSVAIVGGVVVLHADALTGLDARTGEVLWRQWDIDGYESSPAVWSTAEGDYVVCNTRLQTHIVDPANGEVRWSVPGGGKSTPVVAQEYGGDFLVNMSGSRKSGLSAYRLTPDGPQHLWTVRVFDRAASPVVYDGHVYAVAGGSNGHGARIVCVHLDTGEKAWDEVITFAEVSSPLVADGKLVAVCGTALWLVEATPEKYSILSQANLQITLCTSPTIHGGRLYLRHSGTVACYDLTSAR